MGVLPVAGSGSAYLGESLGFSLMINLLAGVRRQPLWGDWHLQRLEHNLLTKGEVLGKIPRPPMGQKPGGKWKHWGLPHFQTVK